MGYSLSWLAVQGSGADEVCGGLGLERRGGSYATPGFAFYGTALPTGWYLVVGNRSGYKHITHGDHAALSESHDVVVCEVEEHVMYASAALWRGGACVWKVVHESDHGIYHLAVEGEPPAAFESVRAECVARQDAEGGEDAGVDFIFEVPLRLAQAVAGYKHDEVEVAGQEPRFEELALRKGAKRSRSASSDLLWTPWRLPREDRPPVWSWPFVWLLLWLVDRDESRQRR